MAIVIKVGGLTGEPVQTYGPFVVSEHVRCGDALRMKLGGIRLLQDGDGLRANDYYAINDALPGESIRCVSVSAPRTIAVYRPIISDGPDYSFGEKSDSPPTSS